MITGRMRRYAALRSFVIKRKNSISRTSCLEGTDLLKIFALKKQCPPARVIQPRIRSARACDECMGESAGVLHGSYPG